MKKNATTTQIFEQAMQLCETRKEMSELASALVILGMAMLRGLDGHEFADGFLSSEVNSTDKIVIKAEFLN